MHLIELTDEELGVAQDLRMAAEYGTEWDMVLEGVAEKLEAADKATATPEEEAAVENRQNDDE